MIKQQEGLVLDTVIDVGDEVNNTTVDIVHKADKTGKPSGKITVDIAHEAGKTTVDIVHKEGKTDK
jgi:hypothetical protein